MKKIFKEISSFLMFFILITLNSSLVVVFYSSISKRNQHEIAILILIFIIITSLLCTLIDLIRRKLVNDKPVNDIINATKEMAKGNFDIYLVTSGKNQLANYDLIKQNLNLLAKELSTNEVLKNDFIANVSHEIKTPLAVINNYIYLLKNQTIDKEEKNYYLDEINKAIVKLTALVSNILKLNKLENNQLELNELPFNLSESLINQILQYETAIDEKNITLECDIEENIQFISEESYVEIIWSNLISNAIKFSHQNGIIKIKLTKENDFVIFQISDNGIGMDQKVGKHIFDKFYQGDISHAKEGNGLGLALVKSVINIIGGTISVESEINKGTCFTVKLRGNINGR